MLFVPSVGVIKFINEYTCVGAVHMRIWSSFESLMYHIREVTANAEDFQERAYIFIGQFINNS